MKEQLEAFLTDVGYQDSLEADAYGTTAQALASVLNACVNDADLMESMSDYESLTLIDVVKLLRERDSHLGL